MLGINQTIVFALFMVIIGAFIGTEDLGQYILKALSDLKRWWQRINTWYLCRFHSSDI